MNRTTLCAFVIFVSAIFLLATVSPNLATATPQDAQAAPQGMSFAQLTINGQNYSFEESGSRVPPRTFNLNGLYRNLGGVGRSSLVNLLGEIGDDGWVLVDVSQDRNIYLFQR